MLINIDNLKTFIFYLDASMESKSYQHTINSIKTIASNKKCILITKNKSQYEGLENIVDFYPYGIQLPDISFQKKLYEQYQTT